MPLSIATACIFQQGSWQGSKGCAGCQACSYAVRAAAVTEGRVELHFETNFKKDMGGWGFFGP